MAEAYKEAIQISEEGHHGLFTFEERVSFGLTPETELNMTLREIATSRYDNEQIFTPGATSEDIQQMAQPHLTSYQIGNWEQNHRGQYAPTLNIVEEYYTKNGVPIEGDKTTSVAEQYGLIDAPDDQPAFFIPDYKTIKLHLNREPRFYANISFDGGRWFTMESDSPGKAYGINSKKGGIAEYEAYYASVTDYFSKKVCNYKNQNCKEVQSNHIYPNTHLRLADLYLIYSGALNETVEKSNPEVYEYIQRIRHRAGLDVGTTSQNAWAQYSRNPTKPLPKEGMREVMHRRRPIEMQFEGCRMHDLRRWKECGKYLNTQVHGLSTTQKAPELFHRPVVVYTREFSVCDYLWPLRQENLNKNIRLIQDSFW